MSESVGTFRWNSSTTLIPIPGMELIKSFQTRVFGVVVRFGRRVVSHFE